MRPLASPFLSFASPSLPHTACVRRLALFLPPSSSPGDYGAERRRAPLEVTWESPHQCAVHPWVLSMEETENPRDTEWGVCTVYSEHLPSVSFVSARCCFGGLRSWHRWLVLTACLSFNF